MSKETVDVQDYLDNMADGFRDGIGTNDEFEKVQALLSQAFCFGLDRRQQEIESLKAQLEAKNNAILFADECRQKWYELAMRKNKALQEAKAQLAQYQSDDYVLVPRIPTKKMIIAGHGQWLPENVYKAMIEAQEKDDAKP